MHGGLRRAVTAEPMRRSVPEIPDSPPDPHDWAQAELSSYFKQHPEKLSSQLDRIMDRLRASQGDMQTFIVELDCMIDQLNADIDKERRGVVGRDKLMRDYPDVTNEFLHFFLDGIMEAMEEEQASHAAAGPAAGTGSSSGGGGSVGAAAIPRCGSPLGKMRPRSSGSSGSSKERFSNVAKRMQA